VGGKENFMPSNFEKDMVNGEVIEASHVAQYADSIRALENGKAFYREASGTGSPYVVDFRADADPDVRKHHLTTDGFTPEEKRNPLEAGQIIVFKANIDSPDNATLQLILEDGATGTNSAAFPLTVGDDPIQEGDIMESQIVVAIYNDTTSRFDVIGLGSSTNSDSFELGDILFSYRPAPTGFIQANGQIVSQSLYADLYALIGLIVDDATTWVSKSTPNSNPILGLGHGAGLFVAVGFSGTIWTSPDGSTWTSQSTPSSLPAIQDVTYGDGLFVAVGSNGTIWTSPDGSTWTAQATPGNPDLTDVAYGNGVFTAISSWGGTLWTSPDGSSWTAQSIPGNTSMYGIVYGNNSFVAVGTQGRVWTSPNGSTWTSQSTPSSSPTMQDVTYGDGLFVAVGSNSTIWTSPDSSNWTAQSTPVSSTGIQGVTSSNGRFVTVASQGRVWTSPDGSNWTAQSTPSSTFLNGVTYSNGLFVAAGYSGTIWTSSGCSYDSETEFKIPNLSPSPPSLEPTPWIKALP
jgi:hypothetical protein